MFFGNDNWFFVREWHVEILQSERFVTCPFGAQPFRIFVHEISQHECGVGLEYDFRCGLEIPSNDVRFVLGLSGSVPIRQHFLDELERHRHGFHGGVLQVPLPVMRIRVEMVEPGELEGEIPGVRGLEVSLLSRLSVRHILGREEVVGVGNEFPGPELREVVREPAQRDTKATTGDKNIPLMSDYIR